MAVLAALWRHPVKGLGADPLTSTELAPDRPLPGEGDANTLALPRGLRDFGVVARVVPGGRIALGCEVQA